MPRPVEELLIRLLNKRKTKFPHSLRCFAVTLHFHSPAAYSFVRKTFLKCLPHSTTIRKWMQNIHSDPGVSNQALTIIRDKVYNAKAKNKKIVFNLTLDEMSVKKKLIGMDKNHTVLLILILIVVVLLIMCRLLVKLSFLC